MGLNVGQTEHDLERDRDFSESQVASEATTFHSSLDTKDTGFGAFAGWQFGRWFAVEGAFYHLGKSTYDIEWSIADPSFTLEQDADIEFETRAFSVSALLTVPLGESFSLGLRAGAAYSTFELDVISEFRVNGAFDEAERNSDSEHNIAPVYGVNLEYAPSRRVSLRVDWQTFRDVGEDLADVFKGIEVEMLSISVLGRF